MRTRAANALDRGRAALARAQAFCASLHLLPHCPRCHHVTGVEDDDNSGSSLLWFVCRLCGHRWSVAPKKLR
jgi:transcription elongation factor Elf1